MIPTDIVRWRMSPYGFYATHDGEWVRYADHVAALAAAPVLPQRGMPPPRPTARPAPSQDRPAMPPGVTADYRYDPPRYLARVQHSKMKYKKWFDSVEEAGDWVRWFKAGLDGTGAPPAPVV